MNTSFFQKPSRYINREINAVRDEKPVTVALVFPDLYEIGMSHLGLKILYSIVNDLPYASAERVFAPWIDLEAEMRTRGIPLSSLESGRPLREFDIVGFSLQYELSYTTVLNMLSLGGIPVATAERLDAASRRYPLIIAGGPCTVNPMPMSPFIDAFLIGDGEDAVTEIAETYYQWKYMGDRKKDSLLRALSHIEGVFVPLCPPKTTTRKNGDAQTQEAKTRIRRRILASLDGAPYPERPVVPYTAIVHDRANIEVSRGCSMGCRFCQAGMIYRPVRERSPDRVVSLAEATLKNTGYEEIGFTSLNAGDYPHLLEVVRAVNARFCEQRVAVSLPSLRVSSINPELLSEIRSVRKTGFTIAPEAGSERLRSVVNKDFSGDEYERALHVLFREGWLNLKLYFMIGLPTETEEDVEGIIAMAVKARQIAKQYTKRFVNISVSISPFTPKAHTPFQWCGQMGIEKLRERKLYLHEKLSRKGLTVKGHSIHMSVLEAAFSRGDAALARLIERAWSLGCRLDGWTETFDFRKWEEAMHDTGIDARAFAEKPYAQSDPLPWDFIDIGISEEFLWREYQKALSGERSTDCRKVCHRCGLDCGQSASPPDVRVGRIPESPVGSPQIITRPKRFNPVTVRVEFSKIGELRYLSHLELIAVFHRALRRAGFPLQFSKGFHPLPRLSFGPPLGVGIAGVKEYFDMEVVPPFDVVARMKTLNETLPASVPVRDMALIPADAPSLTTFICRYEYHVKGFDAVAVKHFLSQQEIPVLRENGTINIKELVEDVSVLDEDSLRVVLTDHGETKVRLGEIMPILCKKRLEELDITRVGLYGWKDGWVTPIEQGVQWTAKF